MTAVIAGLGGGGGGGQEIVCLRFTRCPQTQMADSSHLLFANKVCTCLLATAVS